MGVSQEAKLRLIVELVTANKSAFAGLVTEADRVAQQVSSALNGIHTSMGGSAASDPFVGLRSTISMTRGEMEELYTKTAVQFNRTMGVDIPAAVSLSNADLMTFSSRVSGANVVLPEMKDHLDNLNKMFAYGYFKQASDDVKSFGEAVLKALGEGLTLSGQFQIAMVDIRSALAINKDLSVDWKDASASGEQLASVMDKLGAAALKTALATKFNDSQIMEMTALLAQNGVSSETMLNGAIDAVAGLAQATNSEWKPAAQAITNVLHAMGNTLTTQFKGDMPKALSAVTDILTNINQVSGRSLDTLSTSLKYVLPVANSFGMSFEDVATALGLLTRAGIEGSQAGTTLRRFIVALTPSTDAAAEAMQKLHLITADGKNVFFDAAGNMKPLLEIQRLLYEAYANASTEVKSLALKTEFGMYALAGMAKITGTLPADFQSLAEKINETGTAARKSEAWSHTLPAQLDILSESVNAVKKGLGDGLSPQLEKALERVNAFMLKFLDVSPATKKLVAEIAALVGGLAVLVGTLGGAVATWGLFSFGLAAAGVELATIVSTIGIVVAAIAAAIAIGALLYEGWKSDWGGMRDFIQSVMSVIGPDVTAAFTAIRDTIVEAVKTVREWWAKIAPDVEAAFANILAIISYFSPLWKGFWESTKAVVQIAWNLIVAIFKGAWDIISGVFQVFVDIFTEDWAGLWEDVKQIFNGFVTIFTGILDAAWGLLTKTVTGIWDGMKNMWTKLWDDLSTIHLTKSTTLGQAWNTAWTTTKNAALLVWNLMAGDWDAALGNIESIAGLKKGAIMAKINEIIDGIRAFFTNLIAEARNWASNLIDSFVGGITAGIERVRAAASSVAKTVTDFLGVHSPTKAGPMSDLDRWMPNFMKTLSTGLEDYRPALQLSLSKVAADFSVGVNGGAMNGSAVMMSSAVGRSGRAQVTNNFYYQASGKGDSEFERFANFVVNKLGSTM